MTIDLIDESELCETKRNNYKHKGETKCFNNPEHKTKIDKNGHECWYKRKVDKEGNFSKDGIWDETYICSACYSGGGQNNPTLKRSDYGSRLEYANAAAQKLGFKDEAEKYKIYRHTTGRQRPMEEAEDCPSYFGVCIGENYTSQTFEGSKPAPYGTPGYDWEWNGLKIQHKARCLNVLGIPQYFRFTRLDYNRIADKFVCAGWDDRDNLNPLHIWIFDKNDIMPDGLPFWNRNDLKIYNTLEGLAEFKKYEDVERLNKLKEILKKTNDKTK